MSCRQRDGGNSHSTPACRVFHLNLFLLNQKDLDSKTILPKNLCNMHIAHRNMHIAIESILRLTHITLSHWFLYSAPSGICTFPCTNVKKAFLSFVIFHTSVLQKLKTWKQIFRNKAQNRVSKISLLAIPIVINPYLTFCLLAWDFDNLNLIFSLLISLSFSTHLWQSIPIFLSRASCKLLPSS